MTAPARLAIRGLWVRRGAETVIAGLDLELRPSEMVLLQGPNGSGKSTLLEAIAGLVRPAAGSIHLDGSPIHGLPSDRVARAGVALVHQERHLFSTLTVRDNLALADFARRDGSGADPVDETLLAYGLDHLGGTATGLLSGGEQRLVALARGLRTRPALALLDEPLAALAGATREEVLTRVRAIADAGAAVLVVEHDGERVRPYADRSLTLRAGVISETALHVARR